MDGMNPFDECAGPNGLVDRLIGPEYIAVKQVSDNLDILQSLANQSAGLRDMVNQTFSDSVAGATATSVAKAAAASTSADTASAAATAASTSKDAAATSAANAHISEQNAAASATTATTQAGIATTATGQASGSATAAAGSATAAAGSATAAGVSQVAAALSATQAANSTSTVAMTVSQVMATTIAAPVNIVYASGYSVSGDGPMSAWIRRGAVPAHPAYIQDQSGAYFELLPNEKGLSVRALGAKADGVTVCDAVFDKAQTAAKYLGCPIWVPAALGVYKITTSRNMGSTAVNGVQGYALIGDGAPLSVLDVSVFTDNFAALDLSGNAQGVVRGIQVRAIGNQCQASCLLLLGQNATYQTGNNVVIENCVFTFPTSGYHANNKYAVVAVNTDLSAFYHVTAYGPGAWYLRNVLPTGVTSKFCVPNTGGDTTMMTLRDCIGVGSQYGAMVVGDWAGFRLLGSNYFALVNSGATMPSFIISVPTNTRITGQLRTENQSSSTGINVFKVDVGGGGWDLTGELNSDPAGPIFGGVGTLTGSTARIEVSNGNQPLFGAGFVYNLFNLWTGTVATVGSPSSTSFGLRANGIHGTNFSFDVVQAAAPRHNEVWDFGGLHKRTVDAYVRHRASAAEMREVACFQPPVQYNPTAYVGSSGELPVLSWSIPAGLLTNSQDLGGITAQGIKFELHSETSAAWVAASGRVRIGLSDGTNTVYLYDSSSGGNHALAANGFGELTMDIDIYNLSTTNGMRAMVAGWAQGARFRDRFTLSSSSITSVLALTLTVYVTNTGNSPWSHTMLRGTWF